MPSAGVSTIHLFQNYSLDAYFVPGTVPGAEDTAVTRKTRTIPSRRLHSTYKNATFQ